MSTIILTPQDPGDITSVPTGKVALLIDEADGLPAVVDDALTVTSLVGPPGATGATGDDGADGQGVPTGGTAGQRLAKIDGTDFNTEWVTASGETEILDIPTAETDTALVLAPDGAGGVEFRAETGGGGGADLPAPDRVPASPNADDDEFDTLSGWTTLGTLDTSNVTDAPGLLHINRARGAAGIDGLYKTAPSMPFTVTVKMSASSVPLQQNYHHAGILLRAASGACCTFGFVNNGTTLYAVLYRWTNPTSFASNVDASQGRDSRVFPIEQYLRLVVTSSSSVQGFISHDGLYWKTVAGISAVTTGLTVTGVGVAIGDPANATTVDAWFDWFRIS